MPEITISRYKCAEYGFISIFESSDDIISGGYVRHSEPVTVTFVDRPAGDVIAGEVSAIDAEINEARDRFAKKLAELQDRRQSLLALTAPAVYTGMDMGSGDSWTPTP